MENLTPPPGHCLIYAVLCYPTKQWYVGRTMGSLAQRWACHVTYANSSIGMDIPMQKAIRKWGKEAFFVLPLCAPRIEDGPMWETVHIRAMGGHRMAGGLNQRWGHNTTKPVKPLKPARLEDLEGKRTWDLYGEYSYLEKLGF